MTDKIIRGEVKVFTSSPKDSAGNPVSPSSMKLYVSYKHANGDMSTDDPIAMTMATDGTFSADFDTKVCLPGAFNASIRSEGPGAAWDYDAKIVANNANPAPSA